MVSKKLGRGYCAVFGALVLLGGAAPGRAAQSVTPVGVSSPDNDVHFWNQNSAYWNKLVTYGDYQFIVYWDADQTLVIRRRHIPTDVYQTYASGIPLSRWWDPHNDTALGISPDGRVHVTYDQHKNPHNYGISNAGCASQANFAACSFTTTTQTSDTSENILTYPIYFNDANGNLFFSFRYGTAEDSNEYLHSYNNDGTWSVVGRYIKGQNGGKYTDATGESQDRGVYMDGLQFDSQDRLHAMWTFREKDLPANAELDQHDVYYAYSDDYGVTWRNKWNAEVGNLTTGDAIEVDDPDIVAISVGHGWWRNAAGRMALDSNGQPHLVVPQSRVNTESGDQASMRQAHFWRTMDGDWHQDWVEPSSMSNHWPIRGSLFFDRGDNAYYFYSVNALGWFGWNEDSLYNQKLRADNVVWQGGDFLYVKPSSSITALDTLEPVGIQISTSSTGVRRILIRMWNQTNATEGKIYFTTNPVSDPAQGWSEANSKTFPLKDSGFGYFDYNINMAPLAGWGGILRNLEIQPCRGATAGSVSIDYIRIATDEGVTPKAWEFQQGARLLVAEAEPTDGWDNWNVYDALPGVSVSYQAESFSPDVERYKRDKLVDVPVLEQGEPGIEMLTIRQFDIVQDDVAKQWFFPGDVMGWSAAKHVGSFQWISSGGGALQGSITGNDSQIVSANQLNVDLSVTEEVWIRMKQTAGTKAKLCWAVNGSSAFLNCSAQFTVTPDNAFHTYRVSTAAFVGWHSQTLTRLRLEPSDTSTVTSGTFTVDSVPPVPT